MPFEDAPIDERRRRQAAVALVIAAAAALVVRAIAGQPSISRHSSLVTEFGLRLLVAVLLASLEVTTVVIARRRLRRDDQWSGELTPTRRGLRARSWTAPPPRP